MGKPDFDEEKELERLIEEQKRDRETRYIYSEKVTPRKPVLFVRLSSRLKACMILSLFMRRSEIGDALKICPASVSRYVKRAARKLPPHEIECLQKIRSAL